MKLLLRQRIFSWFDSFDIYDEEDRTVFTVEGQLSWGHRLEIYDPTGAHLGTVKERVLTFLPQFELYAGEQYLGCIRKEFTFFRPSFTLTSMAGAWTATGWSGTTKSATAPDRVWRRSPRSSSIGATPMSSTCASRTWPCGGDDCAGH